MSSSTLAQARSRFQVGDFQGTLDKIEASSIPPFTNEEIDSLRFRSLVLLNKSEQAIKELSNSDQSLPHLSALLAFSRSSSPETTLEQKQNILKELSVNETKPGWGDNLTFRTVQSLLCTQCNELTDSLKSLLLSNRDQLEILSLTVSTLISMNHPKKARTVLDDMQSINPEATLTQLSSALISFHSGNFQEALEIYEDLLSKHGKTPLLLSLQASALIQLGQFNKAETSLHESLEISPSDLPTLQTMIVCQVRKNTTESREKADELIAKVRADYPNSAFALEQAEFDRSLEQLRLNQ
ncbi:Coatomer subunit epsilon (CopE) [Blattamonas nauphoetae]|uniref:Coatomer subunit epsilon (CopE) n=1 Tax=Blattamonas nauphoetae TaxID=2049346 RepID=A0ABQ9YFH6_9EUKA|nr:Coatomer subunit epsilon (CopE) [Blattamonas nauphoetae]